jgi:caffeoyl-CoA O-methyltransferase
MNFLPPEIERYAVEHTSPESELLREVNRETNLNVLMPRMLSGHLQGRVLSLISRLLNPASVLEIGTYTGYSALCLAEGLKPDGELHTIDNNEELDGMAKSYFARVTHPGKVIKHLGDASTIIPTLEKQWDLVFIDADKENYLKYYEMVIDRVRKGGMILADNVLWNGKVVAPYIPESDKDTMAIKKFNEFVFNDTRVEKVLLPIRDGIYCAMKK